MLKRKIPQQRQKAALRMNPKLKKRPQTKKSPVKRQLTAPKTKKRKRPKIKDSKDKD